MNNTAWDNTHILGRESPQHQTGNLRHLKWLKDNKQSKV